MAKNEYVGKRVTATLPEDVYNALLEDAELNGMKYSSRATQILTLFLKGKLALVDTLGVAPAGMVATGLSKVETPTAPIVVAEDKPVDPPNSKTNTDVGEVKEESKLGKAKTNANKGKFGKKS